MTSVILWVQTLLILQAFRTWNVNGGIVLLFAFWYAVVAGSLWAGKGWAAPLGLAAILPQTVFVSTWTASWIFCVGIGLCLGMELPPDGSTPRAVSAGLNGVHLIVNHYGYSRNVLAILTSGRQAPCFGVNLMAVFVCVLLLLCWRERQRAKSTGQ